MTRRGGYGLGKRLGFAWEPAALGEIWINSILIESTSSGSSPEIVTLSSGHVQAPVALLPDVLYSCENLSSRG